MPELDPAAPAQPDAPIAPVLTAAEQAAASDDLPKFREARQAERTGKPLPAPDATPVEPPIAAAPAPVEDVRPVSKRQEKINDYERRIAEQNERIARLEGQLRPAPAAPRSEPEAPKAPEFPDYAEYEKAHPNASLRDWQAAHFRWLGEQDALAKQDKDRTSKRREDADARFGRARAAMDVASKDPAFLAKIEPVVTELQTADQLRAVGLTPRAEHYFAGAITRSEVAPKILVHLADHPEILERIRALDPEGNELHEQELLATFYRLEGRFLDEPKPVTPPPVVTPPKTLTDAPEPPVTLGTRPASPADPERAAVINDDLQAFKAARMAKREAGRRR